MRILFVDDETNILSGLRRMLRSKRNEWDMEFTEKGDEALIELGKSAYDVVVSDMRMPGMDGVQLLSQIRTGFPSVVRIALSGQTDSHMIYRCVDHAHQFLAKPCDAETLTNTIVRAFALRDLLDDAELGELVTNLSALPSMPEQYRQIMEELQKEDPSLGKIGEIIETDVAMTAKILQLVNSAFFGLRRHVSSPKQAAMYLGVDVLRSLVVSNGVFSQFESNGDAAKILDSVMANSTRIAGVAKAITLDHSNDPLLADYAFMAGMLADIGKIILTCNMPEKIITALELEQAESVSDWEAEKQTIGFSHMEVGAFLLGLWGLPNPIVEAVAFHHRPDLCPVSEFTALTAVHVAQALVSADGAQEAPGMNLEYIAALGLSESIPKWQAMCMGENDE